LHRNNRGSYERCLRLDVIDHSRLNVMRLNVMRLNLDHRLLKIGGNVYDGTVIHGISLVNTLLDNHLSGLGAVNNRLLNSRFSNDGLTGHGFVFNFLLDSFLSDIIGHVFLGGFGHVLN
jgi:hypothetical protein